MTLRRRLLGTALAAVVTLLAGIASAEPVKIKILQVNDVDRMEERDGRGGIARLMGVLDAENAAADDVLFLYAGDTISPSLLSGFDKGAHMMALWNETPLDAFVMGNHEFDFGPDNAKERLKEAKFPVVNANVRDADGQLFPDTVESRMVEVKGFKIGIFGLTTPDTVAVASPGYATFDEPLATAAKMAKKLRGEGADLVVALVHTPTADDIALQESGLVDLVISGHDEDLKVLYNGKTALTESFSQGDYVMAIDLTVDRVKEGDRTKVVWHPTFRTLDSANYAPSAKGTELVKVYTDRLSKELDITVGKTTTALDSRRATVRGQEAAIGNLIADATRNAVGAELAITNGGGIRANKEYAPGTVLTRRDILSELPFGNTTVKLEVTGAQVKEALENGFSQFEAGAGRFPQISGMRIKYDTTKPAGSRVTEILVDGKPIDPQRKYTLATNDYMASGGDGYTVFIGAKNLIDAAASILMASQVIDYVAQRNEVSPTVDGRMTRVN